MSQVDHAVSSLYRSLELIHHDQLFEAGGGHVELYIDTFDLVFSLVGFYEYLDRSKGKSKLKQDAFERRQALVDCLLASGWLGEVYLLPPHQAEFMRKIKSRRVFPEGNRKKQIAEFLGLLGFVGDMDGRSVADFEAEALYELVRREAERAEQAFKAVQCILYRPEERLRIWNDEHLLKPSPHLFDYTRLIHTDRFKSFLDEFEDVRRYQYHNNFADAVALVMLHSIGRLASASHTSYLPRFFDSKGLFMRMVERSKFKNDLTVRLPGGVETPILVDADYLIYRATFGPGPGGATKNPAVDPEKLYHKLHQIAGEPADEPHRAKHAGSEVFDQESLDRLELDGVPLKAVVHELTNLSFLNNVWLEQLARAELAEFSQRFNRDSLASPQFKSGLEKIIEQTKRRFENSADAYERVNEIWHELKEGVETLRAEFSKSRRPEFEVIRDLELLRFGLPASIKVRLRSIVTALLDETIEEDEVVDLPEWSTLVNAYHAADRNPKAKLGEMQIVGAALWSMRRYKSIINLLGKLVGADCHTSVDVLYAAACFRAREPEQRGQHLLEKLASKLLALTSRLEELDEVGLIEAADLAIGVGYLSFHLWHSRNYAVEWRGESPSDGSKIRMNDSGKELLLQAAESANTAMRSIRYLERVGGQLDLEMEMKKVYALNQRLYYLTELGPDDDSLLDDMETMATELASYKDPARELWQPTFHDTLARHSHFLATKTNERVTRFELLSEAVEQSKKAREAKPKDDLVSQYTAVVLRAKARAERELLSAISPAEKTSDRT